MASRRRKATATTSDTLISRDFDSIGDYVKYVTTAKQRFNLVESSNRPGRNSWNGNTDSLVEAAALVETGWKEGADKVSHWSGQLSGFLEAAKTIKSKAYSYDLVGNYVDVGRYLSGEPECFGSDDQDGDQLASRVASIRLNNCVSGSLSGDSIVARGVAVLVAVDLIESLGTRCEVIVSQATNTNGRGGAAGSEENTHVECNVTVKRAGEPVDLDRLAYSVAHPAYFRRLGFRYCEVNGHSPSGCTVSDMSDKGQRQGTVEVDSVLSSTGLSVRQLQENVLAIAKACGIDFTDEQIAEIAASTV